MRSQSFPSPRFNWTRVNAPRSFLPCYAHIGREPSKRQLEDEKLKVHIRAIDTQSRGTYGRPRMSEQLRHVIPIKPNDGAGGMATFSSGALAKLIHWAPRIAGVASCAFIS